MRYAQGGGLTAKDCARGEQLRLEAANWIEECATDREVAAGRQRPLTSRRCFDATSTRLLATSGCLRPSPATSRQGSSDCPSTWRRPPSGVVHRILPGIFKAAVRDRRIVASPCEGTKLQKVHRQRVEPLTLEAVQALTEA